MKFYAQQENLYTNNFDFCKKKNKQMILMRNTSLNKIHVIIEFVSYQQLEIGSIFFSYFKEYFGFLATIRIEPFLLCLRAIFTHTPNNALIHFKFFIRYLRRIHSHKSIQNRSMREKKNDFRIKNKFNIELFS